MPSYPGNVFHFQIFDAMEGTLDGYMILAGYPFLRHVELHAAKYGSSIHGLIGSLDVALNAALRNRTAIRDLLDEWEEQTYSPKGPTDDKEVPTCLSIANYVARRIRLVYPDLCHPFVPADSGLATGL